MKITLLLLPLLFIIACTKDKNTLFADTVPSKNVADYSAFKDSVAKHKTALAGHPSAEVSKYFFTLINNDIYGYWKGTP